MAWGLYSAILPSLYMVGDISTTHFFANKLHTPYSVFSQFAESLLFHYNIMNPSYTDGEGLLTSHYPVEPIPNIFDQYTPATIQLTTPDRMNDKRKIDPIPDHVASDVVTGARYPPVQRLAVENMQILQYLLNSLSGKDKVAKVVRYILQLLRMFTSKFVRQNQRKFGSVDVWTKGYNFQALKKILLQPCLVSFLAFRNIDRKLEYVISQLGTYRYILRFGSSPFLLYDLIKKVRKVFASRNNKGVSLQSSAYTVFGNESSLREMVNLYYTICDELVVLHKLKLWKNDKLYDTIERHQALTWQFDIVFGFKDLWIKMEELQRKQFEYNIELQVKERAASLYGDSLRSANMSPIRKQLQQEFGNGTDGQNDGNWIIREKLQKISFEKRLLYLDLIKLTFDACANSVDVFHIKTPPIVYPVLSLGSGFAGIVKLWRQAEDDIRKQKLAKE